MHLRTRPLGRTILLRGILHRTTSSALALAMLASTLAPAISARAGVTCTNRVYATNSALDNVSVIDTKTNQVISTIPVGNAPINPTITPNFKQVYVANSQGGTISVIDVATNTVSETLDAGGPEPSGLAFTPNGKQLVVSLLGDLVTDTGSLRVITLATGEISPPIPVGAQPERFALSPTGDRAYVSNLGNNTMSVVDLGAGQVITTIPLGRLPFNVLVAPGGDRVYVGVLFANYVAVIDTDTNTVVDEIPITTPNGMSFSRDYQSLFVTNVFADRISEISLAEGAVVRDAPAGRIPGFIRLTVDGKRAYFVRPYGAEVAVFDTGTLTQLNSITTGGPTTLAICHSP